MLAPDVILYLNINTWLYAMLPYNAKDYNAEKNCF